MGGFSAKFADPGEDEEDDGAGDQSAEAVQEWGDQNGEGGGDGLRDLLDEVVERRNAVREDAAAHEEHGRGAGDGKCLHEPGRKP